MGRLKKYVKYKVADNFEQVAIVEVEMLRMIHSSFNEDKAFNVRLESYAITGGGTYCNMLEQRSS